eukprot:COSAG04_NODE_267_length_18528_cov_60.607141_11_plen_93_part_00
MESSGNGGTLKWSEPAFVAVPSQVRGSGASQFVAYQLQCFGTAGQRSERTAHWKLEKRFSDFCALRDALLAKEEVVVKAKGKAAEEEGGETP